MAAAFGGGGGGGGGASLDGEEGKRILARSKIIIKDESFIRNRPVRKVSSVNRRCYSYDESGQEYRPRNCTRRTHSIRSVKFEQGE